MQVTGKINSVSVEKTGVGAKGSWTLSAVMIDGEKYKTFKGDKYKVGQTGTFEYTEDKFGKTLQEPRQSFSNNNEVIARLTTIEDLLMEFLKRAPRVESEPKPEELNDIEF